MKRLVGSILGLTLMWAGFPASVLAVDTAAMRIPQPELPHVDQMVAFYDATTFEKKGEFVFSTPKQGLSMALADFGTDGKAELVVGAGVGEAPELLFLRKDGSEMKRFAVYAPAYRGGVNVATGDFNGDGRQDVVTGSRLGGGPHVRTFSFWGEPMAEWFAYDASSRSGVTVASGEIDARYAGDEVVTAPGEGDPALLRVFSAQGEAIAEWYPFGQDFTGGLRLAVTADGWILVARAFGADPVVRAYTGQGALQSEFFAYYEGFAGGVQLASVKHNGHVEVLTAPGFSGGPHVRTFALDGTALNPGFMALDGVVKAGLSMSTGDIDGDGQADIVVGVQEIPKGPTNGIQTILVDLSMQRMWTYERGVLVDSYLVSTGTTKYPTPTGEFFVSLKRDKTRMSWIYGPDNPDNYDLKDVPWVLTFKAPYNIHGAYWHNNFGQRMSHGCVNMSVEESKEVYDWARVGAAVVVQP